MTQKQQNGEPLPKKRKMDLKKVLPEGKRMMVPLLQLQEGDKTKEGRKRGKTVVC